jgi:hypothetical protein
VNARVFLVMGALSVALPAAAAVAVRTALAYRSHPMVGAAPVGSVVRALPPGCRALRVGDVDYWRCGSLWYRARRAGGEVSYVVVSPRW